MCHGLKVLGVVTGLKFMNVVGNYHSVSGSCHRLKIHDGTTNSVAGNYHSVHNYHFISGSCYSFKVHDGTTQSVVGSCHNLTVILSLVTCPY